MNNYSKQREIILEVIKKNRIHPTAEKIYELVIKENSKISRSTVYRNINILLEQGIIQKIKTISGPDKYDYLHEIHYHVICDKCHNIFDIYYDFDIKKLSKSIKEQTGIILDINNISINGICEECKSK